MKNKIMMLIMLVGFLMFGVDVYAATDSPSGTTSITEEQKDASSINKSTWSQLEINYNKGIITETITGTKYVLIYGKSICSNNSCTTSYANSSSYTFKDVLARSIKCSGGEKYIKYQQAGSSKIEKENSNAYWSEEYQVSCISSNTGTSVVELTNNTSDDNSSNSSTTNTTTTTASSNNNYNSSSTVDNEKTGINTYFVVLGLVAVISYIFMLCVKKYNLFKNI